MSKLIVIDGNSIAFRAFYALPLLSNSSGLHTNAAYGFTTMLLKLIEEEKPTHFLVAFDAGKVTFRHEGYKEYKGGRAKTPPELSEQFPIIRELLQAFNIAQYELSGYEADDIIGTLTKQADENKQQVLVVTGDKDMLQLASEHVRIALTRKGISEMDVYDPAEIQEKYGLTPLQIIDLKGLMGDASDNIPGIPGVGEKTALKLLHEHGSVEQVLESADGIKGKLGEKIRAHADDARMSKELATIYREVPLEQKWDDLAYEGYDGAELFAMFRRLEFKSLLEKMDFTTNGAEEASHSIALDEELDTIIVDEGNSAVCIDALSSVEHVHIEVIGDNPHHGEIIGIALLADSTCYYVPFDVLQSEAAKPIRAWLGDASQAKSIYDLHRAEIACFWHDIHLAGFTFDVQLATYILNPTESSNSLHALSLQYDLAVIPDDSEVFGKGAKFQIPGIEVLSRHMTHKVATIAKLVSLQKEELKKREMNDLFYHLEMPLSRVLAEMEKQGIRTDRKELQLLGDMIAGRIEEYMQTIYRLAGSEFNINSTKQLGDILFERLQLPVVKKTKTGYSTDAEVLEKLSSRHEIVQHIIQYRTLAKLQSTYVEGLLKEIRPETGHIHTYYQQTIAATGRLSSQFPNLQNIPIRLEEGRNIRKAFKPSKQGWFILAADYSQIELRVLAHISNDERLIEAFQNDMDIHTKTAMDVFGVEASEVDSHMRRQAKAVNFGIVYGISDYGLSQNLGISRQEAAQFIAQYFVVFQGVRRYMDEIVQEARQAGYVKTLLQRRRYLPEINASNFNIRSFAERTAMNTPIQGSAADIIKLAMVQLDCRMKEAKLQSRMLLQVHDELVFEVPEAELEVMKQLVPEVMESALELCVPLKVDVEYGSTWYDAK